ncbi:MAG TPA: cysteine desulfurase-like protein [Thermoanaerobaculia bacterium]|nr:cysteine desulfurase-like protein [Thermoanaerobaculia bacterium]
MENVRSQFPALKRVYKGYPVAYFDAPGGTQVPRVVAEAMNEYLFHHNANTHWAYPTSVETDVILESARETVGEFLNCSPAEVIFGANMTTLTFHLARSLGRTWREGDEVIVTDLDHHANVAPWRALEIDRGVAVRSARLIRETAQIDWDHLRTLVSPRTKLIAIGGASNACGTVNDLELAKSIAAETGALLFVDAVHLAPHELIDVQRIGCDFLACSSYKFYGPHAGILFARQALLESLPWPKLVPAPDTAPERAETGTQCHEAIAGIAATVDFIASMGEGSTRRERLAAAYAKLHDEGSRFARMLWDGLSSMEKVTLYGPLPSMPRTPTIAFNVEGHDDEEVVRTLADRGLFLSHGDFYALTAVRELGAPQCSVVRAGCACYSTEEEVGRLLDSIRRSFE